MSGTATDRRIRKPSAAFLGVQSAKETAVDDFTLGANCIRCWTQEVDVDPGRIKSRPGPWMTTSYSENEASRYSMPEQPRGIIRAMATPQSVGLCLRSNWGPVTAGSYTLKSQVDKWMTLAWAESSASGSTQNLIRTSDLWIHKLTIRNVRTEGRIILIGEYEARTENINALNGLPAGVVIPAAPAAPTDLRIYPVMRAEFTRDGTSDPSGLDLELLYTELEITLDQRISGEWTMTDKWDVWKRGKTYVSVNMKGTLSDETWTLLDAARAGTNSRFIFTAVAPAAGILPASTFTIDIKNMDFEIHKIGHDNKGWCDFSALGRALVDSSAGFVNISIT
jgi:hypothetical protein